MSSLLAALMAAQVAVGLEHLHFRTAATPLNRDNVLGLEPGADVMRGTLSVREARGPARGVFRGLAERSFGFVGDEAELVVREAYLQLSHPAGAIKVGKQRVTWGSGFAWNPTNRLEPPKNPLHTGLEQEGVLAARLDWSASERTTLTLVGARVDTSPGERPIETEAAGDDGAAARLALMVLDSDVAAVVSLREGRSPLFGLDAARGLGGNVVAHAEAALYRGSELAPAREETFVRLAAGLLYTRDQQAFALEYFHNGEGYSDDERQAWLARLQQAPLFSSAYLAAAIVPQDGLGLGRDYLQASWTRSQIGGVWGVALRALFSITDGGTALTPGVSYAPGGRLTVNADAFALLGPSDSEYRLSPIRGGVVTRVTVHF